ncbi:MAG TPA: hypothetical protein PKE31_02295 [Pseudomonadota bacterium]|jgi:pimeloyl-CoA synthetase|nr:hypothetical protein [Pseudomonadota bacterium]
MKQELVQKVLENEASVQASEKGAYIVGEEVELTVLLEGFGQEPLAVPKVKKIVLGTDMLLLETHKGERIYTDAATGVRALKFSPQDANKSRGTGFAAHR